MKIITYTLNSDGTVPSYVINGGYFSVQNKKNPPQDWDFIGWASDDAVEAEIADLKSHLISIGAESWEDPELGPFDIDKEVNNFISLKNL